MLAATLTLATAAASKPSLLFLFADEMDGRILDPNSPQVRCCSACMGADQGRGSLARRCAAMRDLCTVVRSSLTATAGHCRFGQPFAVDTGHLQSGEDEAKVSVMRTCGFDWQPLPVHHSCQLCVRCAGCTCHPFALQTVCTRLPFILRTRLCPFACRSSPLCPT